MAWHSFGSRFASPKKKKSTRELAEELEKLEQKDKDAEERKMIEQRMSELRHKRRNEILGKIGSIARSTGQSAYKVATSKQAKKLIKKYG